MKFVTWNYRPTSPIKGWSSAKGGDKKKKKRGGKNTFNTGIAFNNKLNQSFSILSEHKIIWRTFKKYWWPGLVPDKLNQNQGSGNGIFIKSQIILMCSQGRELLTETYKLLTITWLKTSVLWIKRRSFLLLGGQDKEVSRY